MKDSPWRPIKTAKKAFLKEIDLWLVVPSSLRSMGIGDSWRVTDACWMDIPSKGPPGWYHMHNGEHAQLDTSYITHWMPIPKPPKP